MNKLSLLTSPEAVKEAMRECDLLGRDQFLNTYGYHYSRLYPLYYKGKIYDSKAIVGVAYGKQHGTPLKSSEFSGGAATVLPVLTRLGFHMRESAHPIADLVKGATYQKKYLFDTYGGQLQNKTWLLRKFDVVFLFTEAGEQGLSLDGWADDGLFRYAGDPQSNDLEFTPGNQTIRDHRRQGNELLLFECLGPDKGVRYTGLFEYLSFDCKNSDDNDGQPKSPIIFNLLPVDVVLPQSDAEHTQTKGRPLDELRRAAYAASDGGKVNVKSSEAKQSWYERSASVRDYVLARAKGICEACDQPAPFLKKNGTPYLEPHHTSRLADDGPDHPVWVGAICPNCHRHIHSGIDGKELNNALQERLKEKEAVWLESCFASQDGS